MTQVIALCAICLFAALLIVIGIHSYRRTKTMDGFLLGGRKMGAWMSAFAYGTTYFSAVLFIGYAGKFGWDVGFPSLWIGVGNAVFGSFLAWVVLANRTREMTHRLSARTMPEFFEGRYGSSKMKLYSALLIFIFLVPYAASVYKGLGSLFSAIFPQIQSAETVVILIVGVLTAVYLVAGGYLATVLTDFVQGIIMIGGVILMVVLLLANPQVGGFSGLVSKLREVDPSLVSVFGGSNFKVIAVNILLTSFGVWGLPQMVNKFYAIKDKQSIKKATVVSSAIALIIGGCAYFAGTFGHIFVAPLENGAPAVGYDSVIPTMLMSAFGSNLGGSILLSVILLLVLSASMSTLSSVVLTSSSAVTVDIIGHRRKNFEKRQLMLTRVFCLMFVILSIVFATFKFAIIVSIMSFSWGIVSGSFIAPYLFGLYSKKITRAGAWSGLLGGFLTVICLTVRGMLISPALGDGLYAAFQDAAVNSPIYGVIAMGLSLVLVPLVSLFTRKLPEAVTDAAFAGSK